MKSLVIGFLRLMQITAILGGLMMMLLENDDFYKQMLSLGIGLILFLLGAVPAAVESMISYEEEKDEYIG